MATTAHQLGTPQYLNYSRFVAPGVIEMKDGALLTSCEYWGPDQEYEDFGTMAYLAQQLKHDFVKLSNGWMLETNSLRVPMTVAPGVHHCPDPTSALIFAERAQRYATGTYYETKHVMTLTYLPPSAARREFSEYFFEGQRSGKQQSRQELLSRFLADTEEIMQALRQSLVARRLDDDELIHFLRVCVTGQNRVVGYPEEGDRLDYVIGGVPMHPHGNKIGEFHTKVIGVTGFPDGTHPQMFAQVLNFPFSLRMSQRFIALSEQDAVKDLDKKKTDFAQLNDYNPKRMFWNVFRNLSSVDPNNEDVVATNNDAERQKQSVGRQITEIQEGRVRGGYYTMTVVLQDEDHELVKQHAEEVVAHINQLGLDARIETDNAAEALGGSWPGHGTRNVRKPPFTTTHLANVLPTSKPWVGEKVHPSPYYPPNSGPLMIVKTTGRTPFYLNTHVKDLANFMMIGPSGNGKTFGMSKIALAHLQYPDAQVNFWDRDAGAVVPTLACGGEFFDLDAMRYAPLAHIDEEDERGWGLRLCEKMVALRNFAMTPLARVDLQRALMVLSTAPIEHRTITNLIGQIQTHETGLKEALSFYTLGQGGAVLDGTYTPTQDSHFLTYDMERILGRGPEVSTPVLMTQFHLTGRRMDGRPTLSLFDEGWMSAVDELMASHIEESSATGRKKNCSLGLVLHSPGDLRAFPRADLLLTNIATIIFLPNEHALTEGPNGLKQHYQALGLNDRQIRRLAEGMRPKQDYLCKQGKNVREFQFDSGPLELAVLGVNGRDHKTRVFALREQFGDDWVAVWLEEQEKSDLAEQWKTWGQQQEAA